MRNPTAKELIAAIQAQIEKNPKSADLPIDVYDGPNELRARFLCVSMVLKTNRKKGFKKGQISLVIETLEEEEN